jgi:hypothetical protein
MTRSARVLITVFAGLLALALLALVVAWVGTSTAGGRRWLADRIEQAVNGQIPGRLQIGEITAVEGSALRATDVRFFHPDGREVLHVKRAYLEGDLIEALSQRLTFRRVAADGGSVLLSVDPDGRLSLEAAMDSPRKPGQPSDPKRGLHYDMRNMHVEHFKLRTKVDGFDDIQMSNVSGVVHVWRLNTVGTRVRLTDISGSITPEVAGAKLAVRWLEAIITGAEAVVAEARMRLAVDKDSTLSLRLQYAPEGKHKLKIRVVDKDGTEATTLTWLMHAAASLSGDISVDG